MRTIPVNIEAIKSKFKIEKTGRLQGIQDRPLSEETELDGPQHEIVQHVTQNLEQAKQDLNKTLAYLDTERQKICSQVNVKSFMDFPQETENQILWYMKESSEKLKHLYRDMRMRAKNLKMFMAENQLSREPNYPTSAILHRAIILIVIFGESVANSYFFAKGQDLGLLGGIFQAGLISIANVGSSLFVGQKVFPLVHHIDETKRKIGGAIITVYVGFILAINLSTAHYRALLEYDPENAIFKAIRNLIDAPFGIENFDAWILFIIGLIFASLGAAKGYTSDDKYPEYGHMHRSYIKARDSYLESRKEFIAGTREIIKKKQIEMNAIKSGARSLVNQYVSHLNGAKGEAQEYQAYLESIEKAINTLLAIYRKSNKEYRDEPPPEYFDDKYSFDTTMQAPVINVKKEEEIAKQLDGEADAINKNYDNVSKQMLKLSRETIGKVDEFFEGYERVMMTGSTRATAVDMGFTETANRTAEENAGA